MDIPPERPSHASTLSDWLTRNSVDLKAEFPREPDPARLTTTAYVSGNVGYKVFRLPNPVLRTEGVAMRFYIPQATMARRHFNEVCRIIETDRVGLAMLFKNMGGDVVPHPAQLSYRGIKAEFCKLQDGPPPNDADYAEIDWTIRRYSYEWALKQFQAQVFGPCRIQRCMAGMAAMGHSHVWSAAEQLDINPADLGVMTVIGANWLSDDYALMNPDNWDTRLISRAAREARALLWLAAYEQFWAGQPHWTLDQIAEYNKRVRTTPE